MRKQARPGTNVRGTNVRYQRAAHRVLTGKNQDLTPSSSPKAVIAACMHKLVLLIYGILKSGVPFNPNFGQPRLDLQDGI